MERRQVQELPPLQRVVSEHQVEQVRCPPCQQMSRGSFPQGVSASVQYGAGGNNQAEPDLRMVKVQQKIVSTFHRQTGTMAFCHIRRYLSALRKQDQVMLSSLSSVVFAGCPPPIVWSY